jgi:AhpD family alkylhydroperoxidase
MIDEKTRELIAIGASVTAHCQPCTTFHVKKAQELGVSTEMIKEAIEVGQMVERGAGEAMRDFIKEKMGATSRPSSCCSGGDCCCK